MARVELAYPYTGADGKQYRQGQAVDLDAGLAAKLVNEGIARRAEQPAPNPAPPAKTKEA